MDLTQLSLLADECLAGGVFSLPPDRIDDGAVRALMHAFLPAGLRLAGAVRDDGAGGGPVRLHGRTMDPVLGLADLAAALELGVEGGAPYLSLRLSALPFGWTPAGSLPPVADSLVESFAWEDAALLLDSRRPHAVPDGLEEELGLLPPGPALSASLRRGLSLEATLRPGPELAALGWVIGTPRVRGGVEPTAGGAPRMWLASGETGAPLELGPVSLAFGFELASALVAPAGDAAAAYPTVRARLVSDLSFASGGEVVRVPLAAAFATPDPATVYVTGRPAAATAVLLSALPELLGDLPLGELVPADGPDFDALVLDLVAFEVAASRPWLLASSARVALAEPWPVGIGGLRLAVRGLSAEFTAVTPPGGRASFGALLRGTVEVEGADAALDGSIGLPGLDFACGLAEGVRVDLTGLLGGILPDVAAVLPRLVCTGLELGGNPRTGRYQLSARLAPEADPWTLDVGVARLTVSEVLVLAARTPGATPAVTGQVSGRIRIGDADLRVDWEMPGAVELAGELPDMSMRALAEALCGGFAELPPGFPDLVFEDAWVRLTAGGKRYDFTLSTAVRVGKMELGTVVFEVRKSQTDTGYMAGFLVPARWTPAELWSELDEVFGWLTLRDPGLIVSSVDTAVPTANLRGMGALPGRIVPGVTFFATLELEGVLAPVGTILGATHGLNLSTVIANDVRQTRLVAATGAPATAGSVAFEGFSLILSPAASSIELRSGTRITVSGDVLDLSLAGILEPTGALTAALSLRSVTRPGGSATGPEEGWSDPAGLRGLTIYGVGGALSVEAAGWSIALEGSFSVGAGGADDRLAFGFALQLTNGVLPSAAVASLRSAAPGGVTLTRMVRGFTSVDLGDYSVPVPAVPAGAPGGVGEMVPARVSPADALDQLVLRTLSGFLVLDPTGFRSPVDPTFVYRGVGFHAAGALFGLGIVADLDFQYTTGVYARGALEKPIDLFGVVKLSDADGTGGARFVVDTKQIALGGDLLAMSGALVVFGAKAKLDARLRRDRLEFDLEVAGVPGVRACGLRCSLLVPTSLDVSGVAEVVLEGDVRLRASGVDLGTLHLSGTAARVELAAGADVKGTRLSAAVRMKVASDLPEIGFSVRLEASFTDLAQLAGAVLAELQKEGWKLLRPALGGAEAFCRLAQAGVVALDSDAATALRHGYGMAAGEAARTLRAAGRTAAQAGKELEHAYAAGSAAVGGALRGAAYPVAQVDGALRSVYRLDAAGALAAMRASGYAAAELARGYGWAESNAARMLRTAGYAADVAMDALHGVYGTAAGAAARLMKGAGYAADETARALGSVYHASAEEAGKLLKGAGYTSSQIAGVMKDVYGWSAKSTSKYMKGTLDYGKKTVDGALHAAGYSKKEIDKALDDAWKGVKSGVGKLF